MTQTFNIGDRVQVILPGGYCGIEGTVTAHLMPYYKVHLALLGDLCFIESELALVSPFLQSGTAIAAQGSSGLSSGYLDALRYTMGADWAVPPPAVAPKSPCECGGHSAGTTHSHWCPVFKAA
jgi:hypothetical protein